MGSSPAKPEFCTVLADKEVTHGEKILLSCNANTEDITASWEKNGSRLRCVEGKHTVKQIGKKCVLEISNAEETDEGNYTLTLSNSSGSVSCSAFVRVTTKNWREIEWSQDKMINDLKTFKICDKVEELRFFLYGPVGAGKSSIINTIKTIFEGRLFVNCHAAAGSTTSHTLQYEQYRFSNGEGSFPFAFSDIMGVEEEHGVHTKDIVSALKGHMKEGYMFNSRCALPEDNFYYNHNPSLSDQMHCLVYVIPADKISLMGKVINKIKGVRETANTMKIPQVVFMTRVDCICPITKKNLQNIYKSKKIKDKICECSNTLGVPENCVFPIWNYHEEININENINCLMLDALTHIIHYANDYVVKYTSKKTSHQQTFKE